uniref:acyl-CoA thioesterase n=1 Tax=uncultured Micrococcus sp. TaxID=114051 RepID=UPI0026359413|nr:thioesterase family protein [uncultured Micrococcus sp.]
MSTAHDPAPFETELQLRWSDQDAYGHVNNGRLVTLAEEARVRALAEWAYPLTPGSGALVVRTLSLEYLRPVHYAPALTARVWVSRIGTTSFVLQHALIQDGAVAVTAEALMVHLTADMSATAPLSPTLREAFEAVHRPGVSAAQDL